MRTLSRSSTIECMLTQPDIHLETARHRIRRSCRPISSLSMRQKGACTTGDPTGSRACGSREPAREDSPVRHLPGQSTPVRLLSLINLCPLPAEKEGETQ